MILWFWFIVIWLFICTYVPIKKMAGDWNISWHTAFLPILLPIYLTLFFAVIIGLPWFILFVAVGTL